MEPIEKILVTDQEKKERKNTVSVSAHVATIEGNKDCFLVYSFSFRKGEHLCCLKRKEEQRKFKTKE